MAYTKGTEVIDHKGNKFRSIAQMCRHWGIHRNIYSVQIKNGVPLEDILEPKVEKVNTECLDHLGNKYTDVKAMCKAYGIPKYLYNSRKRLGWSLEKILSTPNNRAV